MERRVWGMYFSPCGRVETVIRTMGEAAAARLGTQARFVDITAPGARERAYVYGPEDLVFVGVPVYAGRVPNKLAPFLASNIRGGGPAAPVVCFGNRSFDNALAELYGILRDGGFSVPGAAALVCEHAFTDKLATGRPTAEDLDRAAAFAGAVAEKVRAGAPDLSGEDVPGDPAGAYYRPLGLDGAPVNFLKAVPAVDPARCDRCGECAAACPMGSIDRDDPARMTGICIKCHACVRRCKRGARTFSDSGFLSHRAMLERDHRRPAQPLFLL